MFWIRKMRTLALLSSATLLLCGLAWAGEWRKPTVERASEKVGLVRVKFYVDGCLRMQKNGAYVKALEGLRQVIGPKDDCLSVAFYQKGFTVGNVAVDKRTGYLLTPFTIRMVDLGVEPELLDYSARDESSFEEWMDKIFANEKNVLENTVACLITNNEKFHRKQGLVARRGRVSLYILYAPPEQSVKDNPLSPDWKAQEWADFIKESLGKNCNDVAGEVLKDYFLLSDQEKIAELLTEDGDFAVSVKGLMNLRPRPMWNLTVNFNGETRNVAGSDNGLTLEPVAGGNILTVVLKSPTGCSRQLVWSGADYVYAKLSDGEKALVKNVLERLNALQGAKIKVEIGKEGEAEFLKSQVPNLEKVMHNSLRDKIVTCAEKLEKEETGAEAVLCQYSSLCQKLAEIKATAGGFGDGNFETALNEVIKESENAASRNDVAGLAAKIGKLETTLADLEAADFARRKSEAIGEIEKRLSDCAEGKAAALKGLLEEVKAASCKDDLASLAPKLAALDAEVSFDFAREKEAFLAELQKKMDELNAHECVNAEEFRALREEAALAVDSLEMQSVKERIAAYKPVLIDGLKQELTAKVQELLGKFKPAEYSNIGDLAVLQEDISSCRSPEELEAVKEKIAAWKPVAIKRKSGGWAGIAGLAAVVAVLLLLAWRLSRPKEIASLVYTDVADGAFKSADLALGRKFSLSPLGIDLYVKVVREGDDIFELEISSKGGPVFIKNRLGSQNRTKVTDLPVRFPEGKYQIFTSEVAMKEKGSLEWRTKGE